jgi:hypothetical protein
MQKLYNNVLIKPNAGQKGKYKTEEGSVGTVIYDYYHKDFPKPKPIQDDTGLL